MPLNVIVSGSWLVGDQHIDGLRVEGAVAVIAVAAHVAHEYTAF